MGSTGNEECDCAVDSDCCIDESRISSPSDSCSSNAQSNSHNEVSSGYDSNKASETDETEVLPTEYLQDNNLEYNGEPIFIYVNEGQVFKVKVGDEIQEITGPATVKMIAKDVSSLPVPISMLHNHYQTVDPGVYIPAIPAYAPAMASCFPFHTVYAPVYPLLPVSAQCVNYDEYAMCSENAYSLPSQAENYCSMDDTIRNSLLHQLSQVIAPKVISVEPIAATIQLLPHDLPTIGKSFNLSTVYSLYIARINPYEDCPVYREIYRGSSPDIYIIDLIPNTKYSVRCSLALVFDNYHALLVGDRSESVYFDTPLTQPCHPPNLEIAASSNSAFFPYEDTYNDECTHSHHVMELPQMSCGRIGFRPKNSLKILPKPPALPPILYCQGDVKLDSAVVAWKMPDGIQLTDHVYILEQKVNTEFQEIYNGMDECYEMTGLHPSTKYTVRVYCKTETGNSPYSSDLNFTTLSGVPGRIKTVSVSQRPGKLSAKIKWTKPLHDGGCQIQEYIIKLRCRTMAHDLEARINENEFEFLDLQPLATYDVTVAAVNSIGIGERSKPIEFATTAGKPSPPPRLTAVLLPDGIEVVWDEPNSNGSPIIEYKLYSTSESSLFSEVYSGLDRHVILRDLLRAHLYYFKVKAINEIGCSDFSSTADALIPAIAPCKIEIIDCKPTFDSIEYSWMQPRCNGSPVTGYIIMFQDEKVEIDPELNHYVFKNLKPLTTYEFRIAATNFIGCGEFSDTKYCETTAFPPEPPKLELVCSTANSLKLHWTESNPVKDSKVLYNLEIIASKARCLYTGHRTSFKVNRLSAGTTYRFRICASNSNGRGKWSQVYEFRTAKLQPSPIGALKVKFTEKTKCSLSWSAHRPVEDGEITYELGVRINSNDADEQLYNCGSKTSFAYTLLRPNNEYTFRVRAVKTCADGERLDGPYSNVVSVNTFTCENLIEKSDSFSLCRISSKLCTYALRIAQELKDYQSLFIFIFLFILLSFLIHVFAIRTLEM